MNAVQIWQKSHVNKVHDNDVNFEQVNDIYFDKNISRNGTLNDVCINSYSYSKLTTCFNWLKPFQQNYLSKKKQFFWHIFTVFLHFDSPLACLSKNVRSKSLTIFFLLNPTNLSKQITVQKTVFIRYDKSYAIPAEIWYQKWFYMRIQIERVQAINLLYPISTRLSFCSISVNIYIKH